MVEQAEDQCEGTEKLPGRAQELQGGSAGHQVSEPKYRDDQKEGERNVQ
jgi:hypothetical protein